MFEQELGLQEGDNNGPIEDQEATQDDFMSLGADISDEELQYWNDNVGIPPAIMLEEMFGGDMDALLTKLKQSFSLESDSTAIFKESGMLADGTFDVTTILDPFSGKLFLSEADFAAAGVDDAAAFMSQVFNGMIDTGMSAGAAMLVADVGDSAYQYAQLGFLPDAEAWQTIRMDGIDLLQDGVLKDSFAALDADQKDLLLNLLSNPDEQALQALVDLPIEIEGKSIGEIILNGVSGQFQLDLLNEEAVARAQEFFN